MTRDELQARLSAKGVDESLYSLDGLVKRSECYCVVPEGDTWKVVYIERGEMSEIATGLTQSEAYDFVYSEFRTVYGWQD